MAEHVHARLGLRLELIEVEALKQRDVERYMAAYRAIKIGDSLHEQNGKVLRAALASGWVKAISPPMTADDVGQQKPGIVRWFAQHIDVLYAEVTAIPPE